MHVTIKDHRGPASTLDCVLPNTLSSADIVRALEASSPSRWSGIVSALQRAREIPDSALDQPLGTSAASAKSRMMASAPAQRTVARLTSIKAPTGPSFNVGCENAGGTIAVWYGDADEWFEWDFEVDVCDETDGSWFYWLIDNGYTQPTTVSVDASAYHITQLDTVAFQAHIETTRLVSRISWSWTPTGAADPWTVACSGNDTTCSIQVHGTRGGLRKLDR